MNAGKLRHRVKIQVLSGAVDASGGQVQTWNDRATVWASIEPLNGREFWASKAVVAESPFKIRMRYPGFDVTPAMRIQYGVRVFDIIDVGNVAERNAELEIMAKERS